MPTHRGLSILAGIAVLIAACGPTGAPSTTPAASASAPGSAAGVGGLPPGCEPIDLRDPAGTRLELDGMWIEDVPADEAPMTWWLRVLGDCIWGSGTIDDIDVNPRDLHDLQVLRGRIGTNYVIEGEILLLGTTDSFRADRPIYAPARFLIVFDDENRVTIREDREAGQTGPRCLDPVQYCLRPLVLRPADEAGS